MKAARLIRFYPRAWRDRYGVEFVETVGSGDLHAQQVIDIAMGAIDAWLSADVRRAAVGATAPTNQGGHMRSGVLKHACTDQTYRFTVRDGLLSALVFLASDFVLVALGSGLSRAGSPLPGSAVTSLALPISVVVSMPFGVLKGQPRRAVAAALGITFTLIVLARYLVTLI